MASSAWTFAVSKALTTSGVASVFASVVASCGVGQVSSPVASGDASTPDAALAMAMVTPSRPRGALIEPERWEISSAEDDPFPDRPPDASCPAGAYMPERLGGEPVFSVDTGACSYLTARQPALRDVAPGETFVARVWHFALMADEAAEAHVALRIGDVALMDQTVQIPSAGGLLAVQQVAPRAFEAGTPIYFHLHNHGDNSWSLVELSAGPQP